MLHPRAPSFLALAGLLIIGCAQFPRPNLTTDLQRQGRDIFRDDTFGNERFWTDSAGLHEAVNRIRPLQALSLGLKVDLDRLNLIRFCRPDTVRCGGPALYNVNSS